MSILQLSLQLLHHEVAVPRRVVQLLLQQVLPHLHSTLKRLLIFQIIHTLDLHKPSKIVLHIDALSYPEPRHFVIDKKVENVYCSVASSNIIYFFLPCGPNLE